MGLKQQLSDVFRYRDNLSKFYGFEPSISEPSYDYWTDTQRDNASGLGLMLCSYEDALDNVVKAVGHSHVVHSPMVANEVHCCNFELDGIEYNITWLEGFTKTIQTIEIEEKRA